jgi:hypothetical protein
VYKNGVLVRLQSGLFSSWEGSAKKGLFFMGNTFPTKNEVVKQNLKKCHLKTTTYIWINFTTPV